MSGKKDKKDNPYIGMAGHLAVMSRFLARGYNAAIPEVDKGDDIFVVNHSTGKMWRVQVKTSRVTIQKSGALRFTFNVRESAIQQTLHKNLHFAFACFYRDFFHVCVISRRALKARIRKHSCGTLNKKTGKRTFPLVFKSVSNNSPIIWSGKANFSDTFENWTEWQNLIK